MHTITLTADLFNRQIIIQVAKISTLTKAGASCKQPCC